MCNIAACMYLSSLSLLSFYRSLSSVYHGRYPVSIPFSPDQKIFFQQASLADAVYTPYNMWRQERQERQERQAAASLLFARDSGGGGGGEKMSAPRRTWARIRARARFAGGQACTRDALDSLFLSQNFFYFFRIVCHCSNRLPLVAYIRAGQS